MRKHQHRATLADVSATSTPEPQTPAAMPARLLISSLGNPAPYTNTLHSAGHLLLTTLLPSLSAPPLSRVPPLTLGPSSTSANTRYTLFPCPTLMNVSGPTLAKTFRQFLASLPTDARATAKLIVLHDELEQPLGKIRLRVGGSVKGHNGLKSVVQAMGGGDKFVRIGVGIGRPDSRERGEVSGYVLRKMTGMERERIQDGASEVLRLLDELSGADEEG
jgi:PTH1 family peptidyl-tRNA hydrolase